MKSIMDIFKKNRCQRPGCSSKAPANVFPVVTVWDNILKARRPANFTFDQMVMCAPCAEKVVLEQVMAEPLQKQITAQFEQLNKPAPVWETVELRWRKVGGSETMKAVKELFGGEITL